MRGRQSTYAQRLTPLLRWLTGTIASGLPAETPYGAQTAGAGQCANEPRVGPMKRAPQLKNVMTPFPHAVDADAPIDDAVQFMRQHKIRHLPVTTKGALKSVVTDRDIKLVLGPDFAYPDGRELKVRDAAARSHAAHGRAPLGIGHSHAPRQARRCVHVDRRLPGICRLSGRRRDERRRRRRGLNRRRPQSSRR